MDTHVRTLGLANILVGIGCLVLCLGVLIASGGPIGLYNSYSDNALGFLVTAIVVLNIFLAIPCIIGGIFLRKFAEWSRSLVIVTSALNILNMPVGSILGCYGLWVLLTPETDPLFSAPPPDRRPKKPAPAAASSIVNEPKPHPKKAAGTAIIPSPRS